jgi:hypothetical protein
VEQSHFAGGIQAEIVAGDIFTDRRAVKGFENVFPRSRRDRFAAIGHAQFPHRLAR